MFPSIVALEDRYDNEGDACVWTQQEINQTQKLMTTFLTIKDLNDIILSYIMNSYKKLVIECVAQIDPSPFLELPLIPVLNPGKWSYDRFEQERRAVQKVLTQQISSQVMRKKTVEEKKKCLKENEEKEERLIKMNRLTNDITKQAFSVIIDKWTDLFDEYEAKDTIKFYSDVVQKSYAYLGSIINRYYNSYTVTKPEDIILSTRCLVRDMYVALVETHTALQTIIKVDTMVLKRNTIYYLKRSKLLEDERWTYYKNLQDRAAIEGEEADDEELIENKDTPLEVAVELSSMAEFYSERSLNYFAIADFYLGEEHQNKGKRLLFGYKCNVLGDGSLVAYGSGWAWRLSREAIHELYLETLPPTRINPIPLELNINVPRISIDVMNEFKEYHKNLIREQDEHIEELKKVLHAHSKRLKELRKQQNEVEKERDDVQDKLREAKKLAEKYKRESFVAANCFNANRFKRKAAVLTQDKDKNKDKDKDKYKDKDKGGKGNKDEEEEDEEETEEEDRHVPKKARI